MNDATLPRLRVEIIAGAANNQLAEDRHGDLLEQRGILYAPDYVINGGGVINVSGEIHRWPAERSQKTAGEIHETLLRIFAIAREELIAPPTGWRSNGSRRSAAWIGCGWEGGGSGPAPALSPWRFFSCTLDANARSDSHRIGPRRLPLEAAPGR